ncbi:putative nucleotidyltransferase substrate binding domain-containing protein [Marinospirillum sp.]|uniref:putative nucleotidyltransferase substrate binding domain-containing protein n=1 Tax=Marinospirillum sp. TaxID=2183934 RepID=UPI00287025B2|nr:putative nucleotidyltransferase substrate binding domain-containing protein [Marinospirillum sp.]MDR9468121.1 putative nucleotidyltransferase substrate binding domain-containing protein [Marinospirillum sp.]
MEVEHLEVLDFLRRFPPFGELPEEVLEKIASQVEVGYFKAGTQILEFNQEIDALHVVRAGAVEVFRRNGDLYNRLSEGGFFGEFGLLRNKKVRFPVRALEDTLVYFIPEPLFTEVFENHELFADAVEVEDRTRLRQAVSRREDANELMTSRVIRLISREPVTLERTASVREAAVKMNEEQVSSLLITEPASTEMVGIITDKDLRNRVVAAGLEYDIPVADIMSENVVTIEARQFVFEAMLEMLRHNRHHLPVMRHGKTLGVIALADIIRYESQNSLFVVSSIFRQQTVEELSSLAKDVKASFVRMVNEDANSHMIGSAMAVIGRSFKQRLLELGEAELGPPPVPYCFLALGSMARDEQSIVTDQDNAMILDNRFDPAQHDDYFHRLAQFVSNGLAACGYTYCTGDIMATNKQWRQPLRVWESYFSDWIEKPTPEALLNSSIFFDLDGVWGKEEWADKLNDLILRKTKRNPRFLACMARNALNRTPPLGFFKDFVMEKDGKQNNSINMKRRGTAPVADLIRVHALAVGSRSQNSFERLQDIIAAQILPKGRGQDLRDALELIASVRIRHQALAIEEGREPNNNVAPEDLSDFERKNLKDAFQILSNAQKFLRFRYPL